MSAFKPLVGSAMLSSEPELSLNWHLTEQDVLRAAWAISWRSQIIVPIFLALIALGCFLIAILFVLGVAGGDWGTFVGGVLTGLMFILFASAHLHLSRQAICKGFKNTPGAGGDVTGIFSQKTMVLTDSLGRLECSWEEVLEVIETRTDFIFFLSPRVAAPIIPKACIPARDDRKRLREILGNVIGNRAKLQKEPG